MTSEDNPTCANRFVPYQKFILRYINREARSEIYQKAQSILKKLVDLNIEIIQFAADDTTNTTTAQETSLFMRWPILQEDSNNLRNHWGWAYIYDWVMNCGFSERTSWTNDADRR